MAIKVCDAIMGTGKSSAAITYLNEHSKDKFIYITPYLDEADRICEGCPTLKFVRPSNKLAEFHFKKTEHTADLIKKGRNIATTHQAFKRYTQETLDYIREQKYTLIIDENVDVLEVFDFHEDDLKIAIEAGYVAESNGMYSLIKKDYKGEALSEMFSFLGSRELIKISNDEGRSIFYWTLPPNLLTSFKDVFILTYLFEGQSLHHFLKIYNIPYERIGIEKTADGSFRFGEYPGYTPEYVEHLGDMLKIVDGDKINEVGEDYFALSKSWFEKDCSNTKQVKNNIHNCVNNMWKGVPSDRKLWGAFTSQQGKMRGKGYTNSFLVFNSKATNAYRKRDHLIYIVNLFMNVNEKIFYKMHGIEVDEDAYALSIMVQWIWRSAIRDGSPVYLYIPSRRMRDILTKWIEDTSKGVAS